MYFLRGRYKTGWFRTGLTAKDVHHFDEKTGIAHKVTIVEDVPTTCTVRGHFKLRCECGETYADDYEAPLGHHFEAFTRPDGSVYYVCSTCGEISDTNLPSLIWSRMPGIWTRSTSSTRASTSAVPLPTRLHPMIRCSAACWSPSSGASQASRITPTPAGTVHGQ